MLEEKFAALKQDAKGIVTSRHDGKIDEDEFDALTEALLAPRPDDDRDKVYCRDGLVLVNEIDRQTFQIACWQTNIFGPHVFSDDIAKKCTPILLTVKVHGAHPYLNHNLKSTGVSVEEFYLGRHYSGSKGELCDRERFAALAKQLFEAHSITSYDRKLSYLVMNTNLICHHLAEAMSYAFGALEIYWERKQELFLLTSGSWFSAAKDMLYIEIIDDFSADEMRGYFEVPHYARLNGEEASRFREGHDMLLWDVSYRNEQESFFLPSGYQKVRQKIHNENVNVITTQHILEHLLSDYFKRENTFVVANTFQTLEYLSRAVLIIQEGGKEDGVAFLKQASSCLGHYPENDVEHMLSGKTARFPSYASEYFYKTFFRAPVLS